MNKIGYLIDEKIAKTEANKDQNLRKYLSDDAINNYKRIFERFEELARVEHPKISQRIRMIILNMLENRNKGWEK